MCKCHKKSVWSVVFEHDGYQEAQGYDGDEPLPADREWRCYTIWVYRHCTRCDEESVHEALGSCWASTDAAGFVALRDIVDTHKMLPRGITLADVEVYYE